MKYLFFQLKDMKTYFKHWHIYVVMVEGWEQL